jgi:hypothetical protein
MKASGAYPSLAHGVSQQVPSRRVGGQMTEQVNLWPDPVNGLCRRQGTRWVAGLDTGKSWQTETDYLADTANWTTFQYSYGGKDYLLLMRRGARPTNSSLPVLYAYNVTDRQFLNLHQSGDAVMPTFTQGGISAAVAVGKWVFMAGNTVTPTATTTDKWGASGNQTASVVWVRGGAFSRKYQITVTVGGTPTTFDYTTPSAQYTGLLDTTGVALWVGDPAGGTDTSTDNPPFDFPSVMAPWGSNGYRAKLTYGDWSPSGLTVKDGGGATLTNTYPAAPSGPNQYYWNAGDKYIWAGYYLTGRALTISYTHTKVITNPSYEDAVNKITNDYNNAVTAWIESSALAITPQAIAESLRVAAVAAGLSCTRQDSTLIFNGESVTATDGGDNTLIIATANEVESVEHLSYIHKVNKVVKIRARNAADAFYMKAIPQDSSVTSGYTPVTWVEGAGVEHQCVKGLFYFTVIGTEAYLAATATDMNSLAGITDAPPYAVSTTGDDITSPMPYFVGRKINMLALFQDRLLIGSDAVIRCSKIGDYLNFHRSTLLTYPDNDPLEMLSHGNSDDTLRYPVIFDRDLVIFGQKRQYVISGRLALTPTNANMAVISSHAEAGESAPLAVGNLIFYGQTRQGSASIHEIKPSIVTDSPESFSVSTQLSDYIPGKAVEFAANPSPTHLFARSNADRRNLYVFSYLDLEREGRKQDAWHRFEFADEYGAILGIAQTSDGFLIFRLQEQNFGTHHIWLECDRLSMSTDLDVYPYLDSLRPYSAYVAATDVVRDGIAGDWVVAFGAATDRFLIGDDVDNAAALLAEFPDATDAYVGISQDAWFTPTNPFVRDSNSQAITTGELTVSALEAEAKQSSGYVTEIIHDGVTDTLRFNGRLVGDPDNNIGEEPINDQHWSFPIGRETRTYSINIKARDWMPFTVSTLEWVGQFFSRSRRL